MQDHNSPDNYSSDNNDNDNDNDNYPSDNNYSTDNNDNNDNLAWVQSFIFGNQFDADKSGAAYVRPVRAF